MCSHQSSSPCAGGNATPHIVAAHPEQGWNLLCNGSIVFDDTGELRADGSVIAPRRVLVEQLAVAA